MSHVIGELSEQEKRDGYHMHILNLVKHPQNDCGHRKYAVNERMWLKNWRYLTHSEENVGSVHKCPSRVAKGCPPLVTGPAAGTNYITHKQHTGHWLMAGQRGNTFFIIAIITIIHIIICAACLHNYHNNKKQQQKNKQKRHTYEPEVSWPPSELHSSPHVSLSRQMVSEFQHKKKKESKKVRSRSKTLP